MQGTNNSLVENLISLVVWPGTYNGRMEESNFDQTAGVEATEAEELIMQGNVVAGAERIAYMLAGKSHSCLVISICNTMVDWIKLELPAFTEFV